MIYELFRARVIIVGQPNGRSLAPFVFLSAFRQLIYHVARFMAPTARQKSQCRSRFAGCELRRDHYCTFTAPTGYFPATRRLHLNISSRHQLDASFRFLIASTTAHTAHTHAYTYVSQRQM